MTSSPRSDCGNDAISAALTSYCFGEMPDLERQEVALHLVECDTCWEEVQRLEAAVRALRFDAPLPSLTAPRIASGLGISGKLANGFAGHVPFASMAAALYGSLFVASVWTELGYSYDRFGNLAWLLSWSVFPWMAGALLLALYVDARQTATSKRESIGMPLGIVLGAVAVLTMVLVYLLPQEPTVRTDFQTRSALGGYIKNILFYFLPALIFVLPPFHVIVHLQRQLQLQRHKQVYALLSRAPEGVAPRGVWFVPPWMLMMVLILAIPVTIAGVNRLLDHLQPGPYADLFTAALYIRVTLWHALSVLGFTWYQRSLNELKREALAVIRLLEPNQQAR